MHAGMVELVVLVIAGFEVLHAINTDEMFIAFDMIADKVRVFGVSTGVSVRMAFMHEAADLIAKTRGIAARAWSMELVLELWVVYDANVKAVCGVYASEFEARYAFLRYGSNVVVTRVPFANAELARQFIAAWEMRTVESVALPTAYYPNDDSDAPVWVFVDTNGHREFVDVNEMEARVDIIRGWANHYAMEVYHDEDFLAPLEEYLDRVNGLTE